MFDDLRDLYQEVILDHGRKPRNFRRLEGHATARKGDNPMCGDRMEVWVKLDMRRHASRMRPSRARAAPSPWPAPR